MATTNRSNPLALAVLVCLYERPMHPYEVAQTLKHRAKHEAMKLNYGSLYNVVESLEKRGLITARETVREGRRPERTIYEITEAGAREMSDWLNSLISEPIKEYPQFMAGLSIIVALPPDEALAALVERAHRLQFKLLTGRAMLREMTEKGFPRIFGLESEYDLDMTAAELEWVRRLAKEIEGGSLEGLPMWQGFFGAEGPVRAPPGDDFLSEI